MGTWHAPPFVLPDDCTLVMFEPAEWCALRPAPRYLLADGGSDGSPVSKPFNDLPTEVRRAWLGIKRSRSKVS